MQRPSNDQQGRRPIEEFQVTADNSPIAQSIAPEPVDDTDSTTKGDLERYGIMSHQHTSYEWNGYRYSNSADAIAAAKRAAR